MRFLVSFSATILLMIAAWFIYAGFNIETTVPASSASQSFLADGAQGVANLQLMHVQLLDLIIGVTAGLGSCILYGSAAIVTAVDGRATKNHTTHGKSEEGPSYDLSN